MGPAEVWIVEAVRTPIGRVGGALSSVRPDDLAAHVLSAAVARSRVPPELIEDVVFGCANQAGEDNRNLARMAVLLAQLPHTIPGVTVNRLCGSGLDAVAYAARCILAREGELYIAGGVESMSRAPWAALKPERGFQRGPITMHDTSLGWRMVNPRMQELGHTDTLGLTAENLAQSHRIDRRQQDSFALHSHQKALAAQAEGRFDAEIVPVRLPGERSHALVEVDEGPRQTSLQELSALRPVFLAGGTVTAGNSSPLNDGAAALVLCSPRIAREHRLTPLAKVRSIAVAGVPPRIMGIGPVPASAKALRRAGLTLEDVDLIELNEAFAAQALAVLQEWGVQPQDRRLNVNGGAIALGHPLGCSGARILVTLLHQMQRRQQAKIGLASMCIGVGQGIAIVLERLDP